MQEDQNNKKDPNFNSFFNLNKNIDPELERILHEVARKHGVDLDGRLIFARKIKAEPRMIRIKNKKLLTRGRALIDVSTFWTDGRVRVVSKRKERFPTGVIIENKYIVEEYSYILFDKELLIKQEKKHLIGFFVDLNEFEVKCALKH